MRTPSHFDNWQLTTDQWLYNTHNTHTQQPLNMNAIGDDVLMKGIAPLYDEACIKNFNEVTPNDRIVHLHKIAAASGNVGLLRFLEEAYQYSYLFYRKGTRENTLASQKHPAWVQGRQLICATAALQGNLNVLRVARCEYDFPWDETTCSNAASHGHWEVLKFAHQHGCPWDERTRKNAEAYRGTNRDKIIKWLEQHNCRIKRKPYVDNDDRHEEYHNYMYLQDAGYY